MRTIIHLSDLHFGRIDETLILPLVEQIGSLKPNVVVVSGDLTQRARSEQFLQARAFLDALPRPHIVVPGNHDVPLYNIIDRLFRGLHRYRKYITDDMTPFYADGEIAILGINTARSLTIKDGRISPHQIETIRKTMCPIDERVVKFLVTHHPFDLPENSHHGQIVGRAHETMKALAACSVDIILSGHLHQSHTAHSAERFKIEGHSALIVQAGTATSTRGRGESNTFNVLRTDGDLITVERLSWDAQKAMFLVTQEERFAKKAQGFIRAA